MTKYVELPDSIIEEELLEKHGYSTLTEFVKESVRFRTRELKGNE